MCGPLVHQKTLDKHQLDRSLLGRLGRILLFLSAPLWIRNIGTGKLRCIESEKEDSQSALRCHFKLGVWSCLFHLAVAHLCSNQQEGRLLKPEDIANLLTKTIPYTKCFNRWPFLSISLLQFVFIFPAGTD